MRLVIGMNCGWMRDMKTSLVPLLVLSCSLAVASVSVQAEEGDLKKATYCHGFKEDNSPKDVAEFFARPSKRG